jgi:hypothetical protein
VPSLQLQQPWTRTGLTAWTGIAASVAAPALLAVSGRAPNLAGAFVLACVPAGAAVMCWADSGEGLVQAGLTLVLSMAATAILSACMILIPLIAGLGAWAFGVSQMDRQAIGPYGVLASANAWFFVGLPLLLAGMLAELS